MSWLFGWCHSNLWTSQEYWEKLHLLLLCKYFITSRHKPHTWRDSFQWRRSERWGHSRWSAGRSQCWTPEQSKILKTVLDLRMQQSPDKAAERADRRCKIHPYRPDKTRLMRFQKLSWKQCVWNLYCVRWNLHFFILPKLQRKECMELLRYWTNPFLLSQLVKVC